LFDQEIVNRVVEQAKYMLATNGTVRSTAEVFGVSKSTTFKDLSERLPKIDMDLYLKIRDLMAKNYRVKHIRGGIATKQLWQRRSLVKNFLERRCQNGY